MIYRRFECRIPQIFEFLEERFISKYYIIPTLREIISGKTISNIPVPSKLRIYISEHLGSPAVPIVGVGDYVKKGEIIAKKSGAISLDYHAPSSGIVEKIGRTHSWFSREADFIDISTDLKDTPLSLMNTESGSKKIKSSGLISSHLFPYSMEDTMEKYRGSVDTLIVSLMDYDIYSTSAESIMYEMFDYFMAGFEYISDFLNCRKIIVVLNGKRHERYIGKLKDYGVEFLMVKDLFPVSIPHVILRLVSGERMYHKNIYGDTGYAFYDAETIFYFGMMLIDNLPMIEKIITVSGYGVAKPQVVRCRIGTPIGKVIEQAGGFIGVIGKVLINGVFMGSSVVDLEYPVSKRVNSIIVLPKDVLKLEKELNCISCGRCVDICPSDLEPVFLEKAIDKKDKTMLENLRYRECCKCGLCSYVCPSFRNLAEKITIADKLVR